MQRVSKMPEHPSVFCTAATQLIHLTMYHNDNMSHLYSVCVSAALTCLLTLHFFSVERELNKLPVNHATFESACNDSFGASADHARFDMSNETIPIFYNLFVDPEATRTEMERVHQLVKNQLALKQPQHKVFVNSIGHFSTPQILGDIPDTTLLRHNTTGSEMITLRSIYDYCHQNPNSKVVYLHSKGSYHPRPENEILRQFLTRGALSKDCSNIDPNTCNVCTSRFSPTPHPHNSGNMWTAHCSYINRLIPPEQFGGNMAQVELLTQSNNPACIGSRRMASEHWVHSHPSVKPCDLYTDKNFQWGYQNLSDTSGEKLGDFSFRLAPRYRWSECKLGCLNIFGKHLQHRLAEYKFLYQQMPDADWWGWKLWEEEFKHLHNSTIPRIEDPNIKLVPMENALW